MSLKPDEYIAVSAEEKAAMEHGVRRWRAAAKGDGLPSDSTCQCCKVARSLVGVGASWAEQCGVCPLRIYEGDHRRYIATRTCVDAWEDWWYSDGVERYKASELADYIEEVLAHCEVEL